MMNKSEIDWCDFSWNPVTGCRRGCEYCYARNQARRFSGDVRVNVTDPQIHAEDGPAGKIYTLPQPRHDDPPPRRLRADLPRISPGGPGQKEKTRLHFRVQHGRPVRPVGARRMDRPRV